MKTIYTPFLVAERSLRKRLASHMGRIGCDMQHLDILGLGFFAGFLSAISLPNVTSLHLLSRGF